jgi:hypothetical protein
MARQYNHTAISAYYDWFDLDQDNTSEHINILLKQWHSFIFSLQKEVHKDVSLHNIDKKKFISKAIQNSFTIFNDYGFTLDISKVYDDFETGFQYHLVTVNSTDNNQYDFTVDDVGSPLFAKAFKRVTDTDISKVLVEGIPSKVVNNIAFTIYINALAKYDKLTDKQDIKMPNINALLIFADEYSEWVFKISANTPEQICKKYNEYLVELYINN